jgi:hypothetical protein
MRMSAPERIGDTFRTCGYQELFQLAARTAQDAPGLKRRPHVIESLFWRWAHLRAAPVDLGGAAFFLPDQRNNTQGG